MKITPEDFEKLRAAIQPLDDFTTRESYRQRTFPNADKAKDVNKRYRWDLLWLSKLKIGDGVGIKGDIDLYAYLDVTHIDTALRRIVGDIVVADRYRKLP